MSDIKMDPYYENLYPVHCRTSCSDEKPCNAEVSGHGCLRCNAIFFTKADTMQARIVELEKAISGILNSPHTKLTKGALLEVSEVDIDVAIKSLEK